MGRLKVNETDNRRLIRIYSNMLSRCYNPNSTGYNIYGGRGVTICDDWIQDRGRFFEWALANGYDNGLQIDRQDVDGNYEPSNCRWVTNKVNSRNKRNTLYATFLDGKVPLAEVAEINKVEYSRVLSKMRSGMTDQEAIDFVKYTLVIRAEIRRNRKPKELLRLKKIIDENFCFMQFVG